MEIIQIGMGFFGKITYTFKVVKMPEHGHHNGGDYFLIFEGLYQRIVLAKSL